MQKHIAVRRFYISKVPYIFHKQVNVIQHAQAHINTHINRCLSDLRRRQHEMSAMLVNLPWLGNVYVYDISFILIRTWQ